MLRATIRRKVGNAIRNGENSSYFSSVATQKRRERRENPPSIRQVGSVGRNRRVPSALTILRERLAEFIERLRVVVGHPLLVS
jgi:hypothetical protein